MPPSYAIYSQFCPPVRHRVRLGGRPRTALTHALLLASLLGSAANAQLPASVNATNITLPEITNAITSTVTSTVSDRMSAWATSDDHGVVVPPFAYTHDFAAERRTGVWGQRTYQRFSGETDAVRWDGDLHGIAVGTDVKFAANKLWGIALNRHAAEVKITETRPNPTRNYALEMLVATPYLGWRANGLHYNASTSVGVGDGRHKDHAGRTTDADQRIATLGGSVGLSGLLRETANGQQRIRSDLFYSRVKAQQNAQTVANFNTGRLRFILENTYRNEIGSGGIFSVISDWGLRNDLGAVSGMGIESGMGLRYRRGGLYMDGNLRGLATHSREVDEIGVQFTLRKQPNLAGRGVAWQLEMDWQHLTATGGRRVWLKGMLWF